MKTLFITLLAVTTKIDADSSGVPKISDAQLLSNLVNLVYYIAGATAVLVIIVAGIMYTSSSGDSGRITTAKNALTYALVGLIVVALAFVITNFVIGRF